MARLKRMKEQHRDPTFESRIESCGRTWEIMVTWQHSLRHKVDGLDFCSKQLADDWIQGQSLQWVEAENRRLVTGALRHSVSEKSNSNKPHERAFGPRPMFASPAVVPRRAALQPERRLVRMRAAPRVASRDRTTLGA